MKDELTRIDIQKMQEELEHLEKVILPSVIEEVKIARSFGDLSENFEYKAAKAEQRKTNARIRYLRQMIASAVIIDTEGDDDPDVVGLFDKVRLLMEDEGEEETVRFVTTIRQNAGIGLISKESPLGKAVIGRRVGERVYVKVSEQIGYWTVILSVEKGEDDDSLEIRKF